jgi:hypothetical protein
MNKLTVYQFISLPFLIIATSQYNIELEFFYILIGALIILIIGKFDLISIIVVLSLIYSWLASTKGLESDYADYYIEYDRANNISFIEYISMNMKSPVFYSIFYVGNLLNLSFRTLVGLIIFFLNTVYFDILKNIFSNKNFKIACVLFLLYFPIFDSSNHLFRQHLATIIVIWGLVRFNGVIIFLGVFSHLTSIIFTPQYLISLKKKHIIYLVFFFGLLLIMFYEFIVTFVQSFIIDRFISNNIVELESLNLFSYLVIIVSIIPLYNLKYRRLFILPLTFFLFVMFVLRDNSESVLRFSKYFHYLIPIALVLIFSSFASYFNQNKRIYNIVLSIIIILLSFYFNYKLFYNSNWEYFNVS